MAVFPCDWSGHRYPQPQQSLYVTRVYEDQAETVKLRLCPRHFDEAHLLLREKLALVDDDSVAGTTCDQCGEDKNGSLYVKQFAVKAEPRYFAADLCTPCLVDLEHQLHTSNGRPMTGR